MFVFVFQYRAIGANSKYYSKYACSKIQTPLNVTILTIIVE